MYGQYTVVTVWVPNDPLVEPGATRTEKGMHSNVCAWFVRGDIACA